MSASILSLELQKKKRQKRLMKAAEKRARNQKQKVLSNADQIRYLAVIALKTSKEPISLYGLASAFREVLKFRIRSEFLLMTLLQKTEQTGIVMLDNLRFGLKEWEQEMPKTKVAGGR